MFTDHALILGEGSMYERLRRHPHIQYDPELAHAALFYEDTYGGFLAGVHDEYISVAERAGLPMLVTAGTWRANHERIARSQYAGRRVNQDHLEWIRTLIAERATVPLYLGGVLGPRGDAYKPEEALSAEDAARFHTPQAEALAEGGADVLMGMTLPALSEAMGMARALKDTGRPFVMSFVIRDSGVLLDGTPWNEAMARIDEAHAPVGYLVNCVHPLVLGAALDACPEAGQRLLGIKANAANLRPEELDGSDVLLSEEPTQLADHIAHVRKRHGFPFVGGCCGTGTEHIEAFARVCSRT